MSLFALPNSATIAGRLRRIFPSPAQVRRLPTGRHLLAAVALLSSLALAVPAQAADPIWLDQPVQSWNWAGMPIPTAPAPPPGEDQYISRCSPRYGETAEDDALNAAGWTLYNAYQSGWNERFVWATAGYDGMCRPGNYQGFVFVNGAFAGTIAPDVMMSRIDGAATTATLFSDRLVANFVRYAPTDPLCCPSRGNQSVEYQIESTTDGPVLTPMSISHN